MTGLPTLQVLLDDGTGTFPHDVTVYARLLDGFSFNRGREDEQSSPTAGILNLAFNNADGRFTPGSTVIATPSPIVVDQRIRVKETINGTTYTRYTGYVKSWRVGWPAVVHTHSVVRVTASCAQARAERRTLRSVVQEEIALDDPSAYYTLGEPEGSTSAADTSGNQQPALTMAGSGTDVVFGTATGPATDGLTAAEFAGGKYLTTGTLPEPIYSLSAEATIECWFRTSTNDASVRPILAIDGGSTLTTLALQNGKVVFEGTAYGSVVADGEWHHLSWGGSGLAGASTVRLDGADLATSTNSPAIAAIQVGGDPAHSATFIGGIAHVAGFDTAISATRVTAHYDAGSTGFDGEGSFVRFSRLAGYFGISTGGGFSSTPCAFKDFTGQAAWSAMQDIVDAEGGIAYVNEAGTAIFDNRNAAPLKTTPDLTIAAEFVDFNAEPTDDDAEIVNYFEATAEGTGVTQVVRDAVSINGDANSPGHGEYPDSKTYLVQTDPEALDRANWIVANKAEPTTRYGTLSVNLYKMTAAQASAALAALEPGAWLQVTDLPSQTPGGTTVDVMVQGFAEEQSATAWTLTCNVVDRSLFEAAIYDDATFGVYGESKYYY